jgi:hypothetical protein
MGSTTTGEIDELALAIETLISENEKVLAEYEEGHTPVEEAEPTIMTKENADEIELFA